MSDRKPEWSDEFAKTLLGAVVLVGITRQTPSGDQHEQCYGTVERADADGITLCLLGSRSGEEFCLPPDPRAFDPAPPGSYRLRVSGETVENPDFTATWTVFDPGED